MKPAARFCLAKHLLRPLMLSRLTVEDKNNARAMPRLCLLPCPSASAIVTVPGGAAMKKAPIVRLILLACMVVAGSVAAWLLRD